MLSRGGDAFTLNHVRSRSLHIGGATPGDISGWGSWLPRDVSLMAVMASTAAATESSSELSVERAGAANEAFSIANSFRLAAPEGKGKRSRPGDLDLRGTHTLAYGREHVFGARTVTCETSLACVSDRTKVCIGVKLRAASGP